MTPHARIYMRFFDYGEQDFIACEVCGGLSRDIHHVNGRGKGKNVISNLMALCRTCHNMAHASVIDKKELTIIHNQLINKRHE
jgi:5-methylcytosine-specific restriction endonuclease McrA